MCDFFSFWTKQFKTAKITQMKDYFTYDKGYFFAEYSILSLEMWISYFHAGSESAQKK
jgi:hypothetical protein